MTSPVTHLQIGNSGKVAHFTDEQVAGKLMTMGVLPGSNVQLVRIAPFKGGYYLKIDGSNLALREREAQSIMLEVSTVLA